MADDSEGRLERRIFQELFASFPHNDCIETGMFPTLFPYGTGVFDQDRPHQLRFVEHRDHLLGLADPRFRNHQEWRHWANNVAEAIEARKRGETVTIETAGQEEVRANMDEKLRNTPLEKRVADPLKIRNALVLLMQTNPSYQNENVQNVEALVQERLEENRQLEYSCIKECAVCHRYLSPEDPKLNLSRCAKCHHIYYCGKDHQVQDWPNHKARCKRLAAAAMKSSTS